MIDHLEIVEVHGHPTGYPDTLGRWPEAESGYYDPRCCRFPKSCSYDPAVDGTPRENTQVEIHQHWVESKTPNIIWRNSITDEEL